MSRIAQYNAEFNARFSKPSRKKTTYGKAFKKKTSGGKFRKGTLIKYKYVNGRRVGAVKARGRR